MARGSEVSTASVMFVSIIFGIDRLVGKPMSVRRYCEIPMQAENTSQFCLPVSWRRGQYPALGMRH